MKRLGLLGSVLTVYFLIGSIVPLQAQHLLTDSLYKEKSHVHALKIRDVAVPTVLFTASALFVDNGWLKKLRFNAQEYLTAHGEKKIRVDDYMQYSPMLAVYGLNLFGLKGKHSFKDRTIILGMAYAIQATMVHSMKFAFKEKRPDGNARNSFPSGHTATAFMGAQYLYEEYKTVKPWIGYVGYAVATVTGYLRIYNNRHYVNDVVAGACLGIMSAKLAYWLYPKCFKRAECNDRATLICMPYYSGDNIGVSVSYCY